MIKIINCYPEWRGIGFWDFHDDDIYLKQYEWVFCLGFLEIRKLKDVSS